MKTITWKVHLKSSPKTVFSFLSTSEGRAKFWAEKANEEDNMVHFVFPNGQTYNSKILKSVPNQKFCLDYFESLVRFELEPLDDGGTDVTLINENVPDDEFNEVHAGWVSVLMNLKAAVDFQCDLRNHDPKKTWNQGYLDN
ncbi:SRPBCC family protein [Flagellimonas sp. S174]|uniref:SRPBCC family protein n=1 Tax=Flagellimonas sp. S174 TaxID=3410790 RepID=UPI003BF5D715